MVLDTAHFLAKVVVRLDRHFADFGGIQRALRDAEMTQNLTQDQIREFTEAHSLFDRTGNGIISASDMRAAIIALGQQPTEAEMERIMRDAEQNSAGQVNLQYFLGIMGKIIGEGESEEDLVQAFEVFDKQKTGYISIDDFQHFMTRLGDSPVSDAEVRKMLQVAGVQDGWVDYRQWVRTLISQ